MKKYLKTVGFSFLTVITLMAAPPRTEAAWYCAGSLWDNEHAKLIPPCNL